MARWIVCSAWPYAYSIPHLGNFVGSLLSADVFARYLRLKGEDVLFVTGSDEHGTPIEVEAIKKGVAPLELSTKVHEEIVRALDSFDISTDNYTRTHNPVHMEFVRDLFTKVYENGYIFSNFVEQLYCEHEGIFLPDRFVFGTCPHCNYEFARGDQCEDCGALLDPLELVDPKCSICGCTPTRKESAQWFFDLPRFTDQLKRIISQSEYITDNAKRFSLKMIDQGLVPRSVTRDNKWGVPAPFPGASDKTIYVWLEAVLGYVSAVVEYFAEKQRRKIWEDYWLKADTNVVHFIGKDNIPFHTIILPALLLATKEGYTMRFHVGATEFLQFENQKFSKSKSVGIWLDEALRLLPCDYWRFSLTLIRPEVKDTNFSWAHLEKSINEELNNQLGNLVMRVLTLINDNFDGKIPKPKVLTDMEVSLLDDVVNARDQVEAHLRAFRFQRALVAIMDLIRSCNSLLNIEEPWKKIKEKREEAEGNLYTVAFALKAAAIMLMPFIPRSASTILKELGFNPEKISWKDIETLYFEKHRVSKTFEPIFSKIDVYNVVKELDFVREEIEKERRIEAKAVVTVDTEDLLRIDLRIGEIVDARPIEEKEKLFEIKVDVGDEIKTAVASIALQYSPEDLVGKQVVVVCNIMPRIIGGIRSEAMLLATITDEEISLISPDRKVKPGSSVY